jgi:hypothetical protein
MGGFVQESSAVENCADWCSTKKSKMTKIDLDRALVTHALHCNSLSAANFDRSEWEIMYPLFVVEGLIDPSERVNKKNA